MSIDINDRRALNTALSGTKVSLSHVKRLVANGVCDPAVEAALADVIADLEAVRQSVMHQPATGQSGQ